MIKPTPNPPEDDATSPYESPNSRKFHEAAERALDHYLKPSTPTDSPRKPGTMYLIDPNTGSEEVLAYVCETLASAKAIAHEFAGLLPTPERTALLGIAQLIMLSELGVNQVLDNFEVAAYSTP
jgi:hypothetical protein